MVESLAQTEGFCWRFFAGGVVRQVAESGFALCLCGFRADVRKLQKKSFSPLRVITRWCIICGVLRTLGVLKARQ